MHTADVHVPASNGRSTSDRARWGGARMEGRALLLTVIAVVTPPLRCEGVAFVREGNDNLS